ncbi:sensory histidine kinase CreC [Xanthomonas translucens pv. graminis]|jgi:two-component system sensor histidine kinase CreC|uniref:histidine kinase n=1 Tax=Xanthomonas graminis pv. graminis TaxID=134874 RepID=A0A1M4IFD2_9XANT|nr:catabolism regulation two-component system sensory histidine kinase [Xanthomonas translucens pv. graminis ART-Xtg29]SBV41005.1 sensory histidine kinase CreC [Xanthomonas translucens pv. graminis]SBV41526.1 sensory histidine kinase CreC [Xanthomonas translucens pv. graminis]SBV46820.1 sensory histidine kinase CreC [Xanthomonas translucens pv. graminis ART-Xtg29]SBV54803.1 sensory histidine kinase CreC [Xanthomonas translucens pv. graminis]
MVWRFPKRSVDDRVTITDAAGVVVFDARGQDLGRDNSRWNDVCRTMRGEYGARSSAEGDGDPKHTVMHVAAPIYGPADARRLIGVLTLSQPNRSIEPFIVASQRSILLRGAWLIGISALIGLLMTWGLLRGIGRLNRYAQAVSAGEPVPPPPRRDEIGDLGRALETMRRKLEGKAYVEQYVQSLIHEMKSPLAAIRGAAELLQEPLPEAERQRFVRNIAEQQQRLTETIDKLLALAEVEQHGWLQRRERIALAPLFAQLAEALAPQLRASGVQLQVHTPDAELALAGDPYLLRQALHNLLDNAIVFWPAGGTVVLRAERAAHARIALLVEDAGSGGPAYALQRVFERFYSLPRPTTGQRRFRPGAVVRARSGAAARRRGQFAQPRVRRRAGAPGAWLKTAQCRHCAVPVRGRCGEAGSPQTSGA